MKITGDRALRIAYKTKPINRYPDSKDAHRSREGLLFPSIKPSFRMEKGARVFTIGSCFARNIEEELAAQFELPTLKFASPKEEWQGRSNGLLNEYNPASMSQRLLWAAEGKDTSLLEDTLLGTDDNKCTDPFLAIGEPVTKTRALERRREIDGIYAQLKSCDFLVITLGLIECWYDNETNLYLNRSPQPNLIRANPKRYRFDQLSPGDSITFLSEGIDAAIQIGVKKILLTVSPVPLRTTFSGQDCIVANSYSKSVLRIASEYLLKKFPNHIDYFPSYEIALSGGLNAFGNDHVHINPLITQRIVQFLLESYVF